ncbi:MAG: hypothetical protein KGY41_09360, partial [Desulfovermiculus sp.]|nr:hypothetical protein [Desulfovermiculus sp.]
AGADGKEPLNSFRPTVILFSGVSFQECSGFSVQCSASKGLIHADMIIWKAEPKIPELRPTRVDKMVKKDHIGR